MSQIGTPFLIGTYTNKDSEGIYQYSLLDNGQIELIGLAAKTENPSFLRKSKNGHYLLATNEEEKGFISSFLIKNNKLDLIDQKSSGGAHPCYIAVNEEGYVTVANYSSGNVGLLQHDNEGNLSDVLDIQQHIGSSITDRQDSAHAHSVNFIPNSSIIISTDLGTDELLFSSINKEKQQLVPFSQHKLKMKAGAGPRHLVSHPTKEWYYVINELNSTVSLIKKREDFYYVDSSISTLPSDYKQENICAEIHISTDGKFLYASNRGHDSIVIFSIGKEGALTLIGHELTRGDWPRNFALSPDGSHLLVANKNSDNIVSFKRDAITGELEYVAKIEAPSPVYILF